MALPQAWKVIFAEGTDLPVARRLFQRVAERYSAPDTRAPVRQWVINEDQWAFIAVTNCGWARLELEAWILKRPGTRRYIQPATNYRDDIHEAFCWGEGGCICSVD